MPGSPAFGQADLTNCERELIHLAGSVQPHGVLLSVSQADMCIVQASSNCQALLGLPTGQLLGQPLEVLGADLRTCIARLASTDNLAEPSPVRCAVQVAGGKSAEFEGSVHRIAGGVLVVEIEPTSGSADAAQPLAIAQPQLLAHVRESIARFGAASSIATLSDAVVKRLRDLIGYDRVMVYKFDPDGHGKIIAEARDPRLDSLLGHHYPASDIPQRARELYIRNRLRLLVNVHYEPADLVPRQLPGTSEELDMSMCALRSMSPLHLQYLKNMGVTATLVISLVREGRLWGLIACHHYSPRNLRFSLRAAADLLAEVVSTRIAAIENYAHAQVAIQVRRLEQRLIEATSTEGDWRLALFRNPHTLLQPLDATGAALFHDGEVLTTGEVPSSPQLRALAAWVHEHQRDGLFSCSSVSREHPPFDSLTPMASGVLAVKLSASRPDYLMWFRPEQLLSVTWAGDPSKPVVGNDPMELSPRRSFAAWSEIVRGTALPWSGSDTAMARAFGGALVDIILQVNAVRLLIAEHQLAQTRASVANSQEPVVIADAQRRVLFANDAFSRLSRRPESGRSTLDEMARLFSEPARVRQMLAALAEDRHAWRGQLDLLTGDGAHLPVTVRAEVVPARDGSVLGFFLIFEDMSDTRRAAAARERLEQSLAQAGLARQSAGLGGAGPDELMGAVLANASVAAMDIVDGAGPAVAGLIEEIDSSTRRATSLYGRMRIFGDLP